MDAQQIHETNIDRLIFAIVAEKKGASQLYQEIIDEMSEKLTPTKVTRIIRGSASIDTPLYEIRALYDVLKIYKPDLSYDTFMKVFN
jgi:hypothetical protein